MPVPVAYRPFNTGTAPDRVLPQRVRHPLFALLGLRPLASQHSEAEDRLLRRYAQRAGRVLVEIGVAEGGSAVSLREEMPADGCLYLIDPFFRGRLPFTSATRLVAHRAVDSVSRGQVVWLEQYSFEAVRSWPAERAIDLLFIDGDHSEQGCRRDWDEWHGFVRPGGYVIFHDSCLFAGGWTTPDDGPVRVVQSLFHGARPLPGWRIVETADSVVVVERLP
jgi:predicted O-methyltransferase YrrM